MHASFCVDARFLEGGMTDNTIENYIKTKWTDVCITE